MNRPLKPAASDDAIDVDAQAIEGGDSEPATRRTHFASSARKVIDQQFSGLRAVKVLTPTQRENLAKVEEMLQLLLDDIDRTEAASAVPVEVPVPVAPATTVAPPEEQLWPDDDEADQATLPKLSELFPLTPAGLEALEQAMAEHGSGVALGQHLGNTSKNPSRWISDHRKRIKKAIQA